MRLEIVSAYFSVLHSGGYQGLLARVGGLSARLMFVESLGPSLAPTLKAVDSYLILSSWIRTSLRGLLLYLSHGIITTPYCCCED